MPGFLRLLIEFVFIVGLSAIGLIVGATSVQGGMEDHWRWGLVSAAIGMAAGLAIVMVVRRGRPRSSR